MRLVPSVAAIAALLLAAPDPAAAQSAQRVRIGLVATLTGPAAVLGQHTRDGFQLAVRQFGGQLGGVPAEVIVTDDELRPEIAVTRVQGLIELHRVDAVVGIVFSNVLMATARQMVEGRTVFIGTNAGPSPLAGRQCSPYLFNVAYQNDQNAEAAGRYAGSRNFRRMVLIAPNYQAGRDVLAGFKRTYGGEVIDEIFTTLNQPDYSAELARIATLRPDAVFVFMPGGAGVDLVRQWRQAGLQVPMLSAHTIDETNLPALQDAAAGLASVTNWTPTLDNPANRRFVEAFVQAYGYVPSNFAAHAYDAAMLLDAAIRSLDGNVSDRQALIRALRQARFDSVRGNFRLGANQFPIQDYYLAQAERRPDGRYQTTAAARVAEGLPDAYAGECRMP